MYACATIVKKKHRAVRRKPSGFGRNSTHRKSSHDKDLAKGSGIGPARVDFAPPHSICIQN